MKDKTIIDFHRPPNSNYHFVCFKDGEKEHPMYRCEACGMIVDGTDPTIAVNRSKPR